MADTELVFKIPTLATTRALAARLATELVGGELIGLRGELGAGKTEFVRAVAEALGVRESVSSPTFVLEHVYLLENTPQQIAEIHHWDLYRLNSETEELEISEQVGNPNCLTFVEWPERIAWVSDLLSCEIILAFPDVASGEEARIIQIRGHFSPKLRQSLEGFQREYSQPEMASTQ